MYIAVKNNEFDMWDRKETVSFCVLCEKGPKKLTFFYILNELIFFGEPWTYFCRIVSAVKSDGSQIFVRRISQYLFP